MFPALADGTYSSSAQAAAQAAAQEALTCIVPESLVMPALRLANGQIITLRGDLHIDDDNKVPAIGAGACCSWLAKSPQVFMVELIAQELIICSLFLFDS